MWAGASHRASGAAPKAAGWQTRCVPGQGRQRAPPRSPRGSASATTAAGCNGPQPPAYPRWQVVIDTRGLQREAWRAVAAAEGLPFPSMERPQLYALRPERAAMDVLQWTRDMKRAQVGAPAGAG